MKKSKLLALLVTFFVLLSFDPIFAQCPMCKMAVESNQQNGGTSAQGLNNGILYLLSMPYILIGTLAIIWIRNKRNFSDEK